MLHYIVYIINQTKYSCLAVKLFSYLLIRDGHVPSEIMNFTQLLTLTMALRLKTKC